MKQTLELSIGNATQTVTEILRVELCKNIQSVVFEINAFLEC